MLAFFTGLFSAIAAFPKILAYAERILDAANEAMYQRKKAANSEQFDKGVDRAKKDGNTCELEKAFNPDLKCD